MSEKPICHLYGVNPKQAACGYIPVGDLKSRTDHPKCEACLVWLKGFHWKEDQKKGSAP